MQMVILGESPLSFNTFSKCGKLQFTKFYSAMQRSLSSRLNFTPCFLYYISNLFHFTCVAQFLSTQQMF